MSMSWLWELHPPPTQLYSSFYFALLCPFKVLLGLFRPFGAFIGSFEDGWVDFEMGGPILTSSSLSF